MVSKAVDKWRDDFMAASEYEAYGMIGMLVGKVIQAIIEALEVVHLVKKGAKLLFRGFRKDAPDLRKASKALDDGPEIGDGPEQRGARDHDGGRRRISPKANPPDSVKLGNDEVTHAQKQGEIDFVDENVAPVDGTSVVRVDFGEGRVKWDVEGAKACRTNSPKYCHDVDKSGQISDKGPETDSIDGGGQDKDIVPGHSTGGRFNKPDLNEPQRGKIPRPRGDVVVEDAAELLSNHQFTIGDLMAAVPKGTPNKFKPSGMIGHGFKSQFRVPRTDGVSASWKYEIKLYSPDHNAAALYYGSNSGTVWTAQVRRNKKLLDRNGKWVASPNDDTHIPVEF